MTAPHGSRGVWFALALAVLLTGCGGGGEEAARKGGPSEVDRLRALPYLESAAEKATTGSGVLHWDPERAYPGYNLYSVHKDCVAELIDMEGRLLRSWSVDPCGKWSNAELQPNGDLLVVGLAIGDFDSREERLASRYVLRLDWNGEVVWQSFLGAHHDVQPAPDDRLVTLDMHFRRIPSINPEVDVRDNRIVLLSKSGEVLESRSILDLLGAGAPFSLQEVRASEKWGRSEIDLLHANAVEWFNQPHLVGEHPVYSGGSVLVTMRHQNAIAVIDWERDELVWSWGQGELAGPHDASFLPNGNILVFDNGLGRGWSRILEVDPRRATDNVVWSWESPKREQFYSAARGSGQRLPNGNTLIAESDRGRAFEVTPGGDVVWSWANPRLDKAGRRATIVRVERYVRDASGALVAALPPAAGAQSD